MTVKGGSRPACAACRFQRRRCSPDCPLAPFFPANQPKIFQNVHRLYGVGNVMKILNMLNDDEKKEEAMKSIKYESYIREIYPVDGCYGRIASLKQNLVDSMRELQYVRLLIHACRNKKDLTQDSDQMINELGNINKDHGFYNYFGSSSSHNNHKPYEWDDQRMKTSNDLTQIQHRFDEFRLSGVEGSPDYTENTCDSFADDQLWFMGSKEDHELRFFASSFFIFSI